MRNDVMDTLKNIPKGDLEVLNKSEMARRLGCDFRTIDRHIKILNGDIIPIKRSKNGKSILDDFKEIIVDKVDNQASTAIAAYKFIEKKGYKGKYSTVAAFVNSHKKSETKKATIRFETSPGLQAQVDWKENITMISKHGEIFNVNIFLSVLGYSRVKYVQLTSDRNQNTLFKCLINSFAYFGGIPKEILFDNMKTVVDQSKSNFRRVEFNEKFKAFANDAEFKPIACRPYRPQTKGKVEALARLMNRLVVYNGEFETYEELEKIVSEFNDEINNEISQAIDEAPIRRLQKEREYLKPLPMMDMLLMYTSFEKDYTVSKESMIKYKGKKYSVPTKYIGKKLNVEHRSDNNIYIYYNGSMIVCHPYGDKKFNYKIGHMHEILKSDACKHMPNDDIQTFIDENISMMDIFLGE